MKQYKTTCNYGSTILGGCPPKIDTKAKYVIVGYSTYFPHCVIIQRADGKYFQGEKCWIVPHDCVY